MSFVQFVHMHVYVHVHMHVYNMYTFICMSIICTHSYACVQYVHVQYVHVHMHVYSMYTFRCTCTVCTRSYARVCTRSYARVLYIHVHMHVYCTYTFICMCMYTFICKCMYTFICKCMYTFICMCMCTFICKCMCTLICISHKENLMIDGGGSLLLCILKTGKWILMRINCVQNWLYSVNAGLRCQNLQQSAIDWLIMLCLRSAMFCYPYGQDSLAIMMDIVQWHLHTRTALLQM